VPPRWSAAVSKLEVTLTKTACPIPPQTRPDHRARPGSARSAVVSYFRSVRTIAFVISPVILSGYRSGPRWLMALAHCDAAEMLGAFDAGIG
jgi:hypothetical protein